MRGTSGRVFRNSLAWSKEPVDVVHCIARRGDDNRKCIHRRDVLKVGLKVTNLSFRFKDREQVTRAAARNGRSPTNFLVLRDGAVYFHGAPQNVLDSHDDYLKRFLV